MSNSSERSVYQFNTQHAALQQRCNAGHIAGAHRLATVATVGSRQPPDVSVKVNFKKTPGGQICRAHARLQPYNRRAGEVLA
jgi:hypothetical protein